MRIPSTSHRLVRMLLGAAVAAIMAPVDSLHGQAKAADPAASQQATRAATTTFLDRKAPKSARLEAIKQIGYPEEATLPALLSIGKDATEDDEIRLEAMRLVRYDDAYLETSLTILDKPDDGSEELDAGLIEDLSARLTFRLPAQHRQRIQQVLRKLLNDSRDKVRLYAYRALVSEHDLVALNKLTDSLRQGTDFPIPLVDAIDLLDMDGSINYIDTLRRYLENGDPAVQARAARTLAVDPQSRPRIIELAKEPKTPVEVRVHALRGLGREDKQFGSYAIPLVEDPKENPAVRYAAMDAFTGRLNYNEIEPAEQVRFAQAVEKLVSDKNLRSTDEGGKITEAAGKLLIYLREAFPVIQKHYEKK